MEKLGWLKLGRLEVALAMSGGRNDNAAAADDDDDDDDGDCSFSVMCVAL